MSKLLLRRKRDDKIKQELQKQLQKKTQSLEKQSAGGEMERYEVKCFGFGKLQVLESKLDIYEDLSKEMLDKLERAVSTISENSNKVSVIS